MGTIFISYRRDDTSGYAGRLDDQLSAHFGSSRIFRDVDTIPPGVDFVHAVKTAIASCQALIALIGRDWLSIRDGSGQRRLDDPNDLVRVELEAALNHGVFLIPVLVEGARMPSPGDLPPSLAKLSHINALEISDSRWEHDSARLVERLEGVVGAPERPHDGTRVFARSSPAPQELDGRPPTPRQAIRKVAPAAAILLTLIVATIVLRPDQSPKDENVQTAGGTTAPSGTGSAVTRPIVKKAAFGSFVFNFAAATYEPAASDVDGKVMIEATVENLAMRALAPRPTAFLASSGENYPLVGGSLPEIPAGAMGKATLEFAVKAFRFEDARLILGDGDQNRSVVPFEGDSGLVANLPQPLQVAGTLKAGTYTLTLKGGLVTLGPIGTISDGRSVKKGQLMLTLFYDFAAAAGGSSSFPNRELALRLPDGTSVTVGDYSDPHVQPGNTMKDQFASFVVDDPARGEYVLIFRHDPQTTGELRFEVP